LIAVDQTQEGYYLYRALISRGSLNNRIHSWEVLIEQEW